LKAAVVPSANSNWEVKEIKMPEPGENQVLIKIRASGMCYTDVHQARGELPGDSNGRVALSASVPRSVERC
jgi:D-arabinose 1-dehydrogenase-like Zn-dependent alcohol dehydrogenase